MLRKLLNFKLEKHSIYNLDDNRIKMLNELIKIRASHFIEVLEKNKTLNEVLFF